MEQLPKSSIKKQIIRDGAKALADDALDGAVDLATEATVEPLRRQAYQQGRDAIRDVPIVGDIMGLSGKIDFFNRMRRTFFPKNKKG